MNGFGEFISGLKEVKKELGDLNKKLDNLERFDKHMVELTAVTEDATKAITELTVTNRDLVRIIKEKK